MKKVTIITGFCLLFGCCFIACSKNSSGSGGGGGSTPVIEENLLIGVDPDPGSAVASSLSATYDFKTTIKSKMPSAGIKIDMLCTKDADNSAVSSQTLSGSSSSVNMSVTGLLPGVLCTVKITVTSVSKPSNTATLSFKVARK